MPNFCPFCGELPNREPVKRKDGFYIKCSGCGMNGPVRKTEEEAWIGWREGDSPDREDEQRARWLNGGV